MYHPPPSDGEEQQWNNNRIQQQSNPKNIGTAPILCVPHEQFD